MAKQHALTRREALALGAAGTAAAMGAPAAIGARRRANAAGVDVVNWAIPGDVVALDPAFAYDFTTAPVMTNVTESLLRIAPDGTLQPNLARSWRRVNPTTYVYELHPGVKFHDGTELTAEDVAFSLSRINDPKVASYEATFMSRVASIRATKRHEVTVKLTAPEAIWQYVPATTAGGIVSKAFFEKNGKKAGTASAGIVGTGPFRFVSWDKGQQVVIERFDGYWNRQQRPQVRQMVYKVISDESTIIAGLGTGSLDGTFNLSGRDVQALKRFPDVRIVRAPSYIVYFLDLNNERPPFDDVRVRQALSYAIDKAGALKSVWGGEGTLVRSPITPSMWTFGRPVFRSAYAKLPTFGRDLAKAKALVKAAGAAGAKAEILVSSQPEELLAIAAQAAAQQLGMSFTIKKIPVGDLVSRILDPKRKDYDAFITYWGSDYPDPAGTLQQTFLSSNTITDEAVYRNKRVDALLTRQRALPNTPARAHLLTAAQAQVVQDQPWVVFFSPYTLMALNKRIGGYRLRPLWYWDPFARDLRGT